MAGAGAAGDLSSSSSSASLSELEEDEDEEDERVASPISTSESLSELLLELEEELGLADFFTLDPCSEAWKSSKREGAFFASLFLPDFVTSLVKAVLVWGKLSDKKAATEAIS